MVYIATQSDTALTPRQTAALLGVHVGSVRRWISQGKLDALKLGDGPSAPVRIPPSALVAFLHTTAPKED